MVMGEMPFKQSTTLRIWKIISIKLVVGTLKERNKIFELLT